MPDSHVFQHWANPVPRGTVSAAKKSGLQTGERGEPRRSELMARTVPPRWSVKAGSIPRPMSLTSRALLEGSPLSLPQLPPRLKSPRSPRGLASMATNLSLSAVFSPLQEVSHHCTAKWTFVQFGNMQHQEQQNGGPLHGPADAGAPCFASQPGCGRCKARRVRPCHGEGGCAAATHDYSPGRGVR